jgi:hypothetical protein
VLLIVLVSVDAVTPFLMLCILTTLSFESTVTLSTPVVSQVTAV